MQGREVIASWTAPAQVESLEQCNAFLKTAIAETQFRGREAVMVLENRKLLFHLQEAPAGRGSLVRKYVERQVLQSRFFDEEPAAWGLGQPISVRAGQRFLLTLLPRAWILGLRQGFSDAGLRLTGVFSPAAVLARHFTELPMDPKAPAMLIAEVGEVMCLVVGRKDGQLWFARSVSMSHLIASPDATRSEPALRVVRAAPRGADRLEQELNRTRLFCQQQFETSINNLYVLGSGAGQLVLEAKLPDGLTLTPLTGEDDHVLARIAATLPARMAGNLLDQVDGEDLRQRRTQAYAVAAGFLLSLGFWFLLDRMVEKRRDEISTIQASAAEIRKRHEDAITVWRDSLERKAMVSAVGTPEDAPVARLFLRQLGSVLPETAVLQQVELRQGTNSWVFRIDGRCVKPEVDLMGLVSQLEESLRTSVFKASISSSSRIALFSEAGSDSRRGSPVAGVAADDRAFFVEGILP